MTTSRHTPDNCKIRKHLGTCEICEREPERPAAVCSICGVNAVDPACIPDDLPIGWHVVAYCDDCTDAAFRELMKEAELRALMAEMADASRAHAAGTAAVAQALEVRG